MAKAKVFLDTNVLLKSFLSYRRFKNGELEKSKMPLFMIDTETEKFTFEKCIFEAYLAFRGIGGKKPDEGRSDWANRFLKNLDDPDSISKLISRFHGDNKGYAFLWVNQIEGISPIEMRKDIKYISEEDKIEFEENVKKIEELQRQRELFLNLCDDFNSMINEFQIHELSYIEIFGQIKNSNKLVSFESPASLDSFVKRTAIPSEDFEIIFSAERIGTEIFVTDNKKLITCAKSLGMNSFLSPAAFCTGDEYEEKKTQWKSRNMIAKLE
ncbi:MAG TPA: hypothetical protein DEP28_02940 [Bacteroidetes bacterium]|nr:hypothetical protein [Bacteroidota bacterium]